MSLKLRFMDSHDDYFPENLGDYSEEQGEGFNHDIKVMQQRYQGRWDENMMVDYCWMLNRDAPQKESIKRKMPLRRSFECKRVRYNKKSCILLSSHRRLTLISLTNRIQCLEIHYNLI